MTVPCQQVGKDIGAEVFPDELDRKLPTEYNNSFVKSGPRSRVLCFPLQVGKDTQAQAFLGKLDTDREVGAMVDATRLVFRISLRVCLMCSFLVSPPHFVFYRCTCPADKWRSFWLRGPSNPLLSSAACCRATCIDD